jgi:hypothetical protein
MIRPTQKRIGEKAALFASREKYRIHFIINMELALGCARHCIVHLRYRSS